jgi:hypothetical protein
MALKKPNRAGAPHAGKPKRLHPNPDRTLLEKAAQSAAYMNHGDYHCHSDRGQPPKARAKPASRCPRRWKTEVATDALRMAIRAGLVSETWEEDFPRHVWHVDGDIVYEARHTRGPSGSYHAYPIEVGDAPQGVLA